MSVSGFFDRMLGRKTRGSKNIAKERLQFILVHDRINLSPERMNAMKAEILAVISKYVSVDMDNVDIDLEQRDDDRNMLVAEIPFSAQNEIEAPPPAPDDPLAVLDQLEDDENTAAIRAIRVAYRDEEDSVDDTARPSAASNTAAPKKDDSET